MCLIGSCIYQCMKSTDLSDIFKGSEINTRYVCQCFITVLIHNVCITQRKWRLHSLPFVFSYARHSSNFIYVKGGVVCRLQPITGLNSYCLITITLLAKHTLLTGWVTCFSQLILPSASSGSTRSAVARAQTKSRTVSEQKEKHFFEIDWTVHINK